MRIVKLTLAYDGTNYAGWQAQAEGPTVQQTLEAAIEKVTGESVRTLASGRTDAGVHALGQVASFRTENQLPADVLARAINANLPDDIAVLDAADAPPGFHPIRDAVSKRYRYEILNRRTPDVFRRHYAWHIAYSLDVPAMARASQLFVGTHDFCSFETSGAPRKDTVRTVSDLVVRREPDGESDRISIEIEADGFLYNMVRAIVGSLVEVGRGARPEPWIGEVLAACDRRRAGPTAPALGLFLVSVKYPAPSCSE